MILDLATIEHRKALKAFDLLKNCRLRFPILSVPEVCAKVLWAFSRSLTSVLWVFYLGNALLAEEFSMQFLTFTDSRNQATEYIYCRSKTK